LPLNPHLIFPTLGPRYDVPRPVQEQILLELYSDLRRLNMVEAPTGIGKSAIAMCLGKMINSPFTVICTATISLQDQYDRDFPECVRLVGRNNFDCTRAIGLTAGEAPCVMDASLSCRSSYYEQERDFETATTVVTNYPLYCSELLHGQRWYSHRPHLLVLDEAHRLLEFLTAAESVTLDFQLADRLGLRTPANATRLRDVGQWAMDNRESIQQRAFGLSITGNPKAREWVSLLRQCDAVLDAPEGLVVTKTGKVFEAQPLWPTTSAKKLRRSANHILLMSATLFGGEFLADLLGFDRYYSWFTLPSPFESWRWPVYYRPVASLNKKSGAAEWEAVGRAAHDIMHTHSSDKGVIHVASGQQADRIARVIDACPDCRGRLIRNRRGRKRADTLAEFRVSSGGWIVHPSIGEGESFDDDGCRVQVIAKLRYPDLGDPVVKLRAKDRGLGERYYFHSTAAYTAQTIGRGMRNERDYCETYILDGSFGNLYDRNKEAFPEWFRNQLR